MPDLVAPLDGYTPEIVAQLLYRAGQTLLALQVAGLRPAEWRSTMPVPAGTVVDDHRPSPPSARRISEMDQVLSWVRLIPECQLKLRLVVNARCLCSPRTDKPIYSYRDIGKQMGTSHITVRSWWTEAMRLIAAALNRPLFCRAPAYAATKTVLSSLGSPLASTWRHRPPATTPQFLPARPEPTREQIEAAALDWLADADGCSSRAEALKRFREEWHGNPALRVYVDRVAMTELA